MSKSEYAISNILVAVDGSEASHQAATWAAGLAAKLNARITAVHAESPTDWPMMFGQFTGIRQEDFDRWRQATADLMNGTWCEPFRTAGVQFSAVMREGVAPVAILEEAQNCSADLVVSGTRGHGGFTGLLLGSVSRHLVHHAPMPVVVVGEEPQPHPPQTVLVGVDGSAESDMALAWASELCRRLDATLVLASAYPLTFLTSSEEQSRAEADLQKKAKELARTGIRARSRFVSASTPAGALLDIARQEEAHLIAVGQRGSSAISEWVLGSVGDELTHHSSLPVVIVRTPPLDALQGRPRAVHYVSEP